MSSSAVAILPLAEPPAEDRETRALVSGAPSVPGAPPVFSADLGGEDRLGRAASARLLADLATHPGAGTPFLIAIHGASGAGKSSLLDQIEDGIRASGQAGAPLAVRVDASTGADAPKALMSGIFAALRLDYPDLAEEAVFAGGDPLKAARTAGDRVSDLRRQLDAERQALDEIGGRQARLVDTVLFNSPGSRIDIYARTHRASIEARLRAFGLPASDPIATYKDIVRDAAEREGGSSRFGMALRALWGFKGQSALIVFAILLFGLGWACATLNDNPDLWMNWLNSLGDRFAAASAWAQDHAGWLSPLSHAAYALGALAILIAIIRAFRFIQPVMRGASLLNGDLDGRRRDIDALLAHQTRRVDHLAAEVEGAVRHAEAAERRVETRRAAGLLDRSPALDHGEFGTPPSPHATAEAFMDALASGASQSVARPRRFIVLIDELDRLTPAAAAAYLDTAHRLLRRAGFVTLAAVDRQHVLDGFSDTDPSYAGARLGRCIQLSYDLDAEAAAALNLGSAPAGDDAGFDRPWEGIDARLLRELSVFAGPNPRAVKRFANTFRVARADPKMAGALPAETAGLALALALDDRGAAAELGAYEAHGLEADGGAPPSDLGHVIAAAQRAVGHPFSAVEARRGLLVARIYSRRG